MRGTPVRTATVVIAVAVVVSLLFSTNVLTTALEHGAEIENARLGADLVILPPSFSWAYSYGRVNSSVSVVGPTTGIIWNGSSYNIELTYLPGDIVGTITTLTGVKDASPQLYAGTLNDSKQASKPLNMIAIDPATDFTVLSWLGPQQNSKLEGDQAVAGAGTGLVEGQELRWNGLTLRLVGILEPTSTSLDEGIFFPLGVAYRASQATLGTPDQFPFKPGQITGVLVRVEPGTSPPVIAQEIRPYLSAAKVLEASPLARTVGVETSGVAYYGLVVAGVMAVAVIVLIASVFSMTVNERRRQLGLFRSLGATRLFIFSSILEEVGAVALVGGIIGLGVGQLVVYFGELYLSAAFQVTLLLPPTVDLVPFIIESLIFGVGIGALASTYPAFVASVMDPYEAIRRGE
ncbi:MAG: ABC transporter permease [Thaumarchaeota archaeon]|nr:ABC transporter permease [Nitrososphaerota archaeon]